MITAAAAGFAVAVLPAAGASAAGPISSTDRDFLAAVHTVASFAVSANYLVQVKASAGPLRTLGNKIVSQDRVLDGLVKSTATRLQTPLLSASPPAIDKLKAAKGEVFDVDYVDVLRATDGTLLQLAATTRVNTRNDLVRTVAQRAMTTMAGQLPLLESTGLVDFAAVAAASPQPTPTVKVHSGPNVDASMLASARQRVGFLVPTERVNLAVLGGAGLLALIMAWRVRRSRRPRRAR